MDTCWARPAPATPRFIERTPDSFPLLPFARISSAISRLFSSQRTRSNEFLRPPAGARHAGNRGPEAVPGVQNLICMDSTPTPTPAFSNQSINQSIWLATPLRKEPR
jgi:hypothetical protein